MKLTKCQLSLKLNVSDGTIYLWEKNRVQPSLAQIPKIIEFLGCDPFDKYYENIAERIKGFRRQRGLSQKQLASLLGIDPSTVSHWEKGEYRPQKRLLDKLNSFLSSSVSVAANK